MSDKDNVQQTPDSRILHHNIDDAADAILGRWEDAQEEETSELSDQTQEAEDETLVETEDESELEAEEEVIDEETESDPEKGETEANEETEEEPLPLAEDALVEVVVDGNTERVSVKDLKRLYGQEAALTRKSQETAAQRKQANESLERADASLRVMLDRAKERFKPYEEVDMLVASRQLTPDDFAALRKDAKEAEQDLKFLTEEAEGFYGKLKEQQNEAKQQAAVECVKVLKEKVPDWSNDLYNEIRQYAISVGLPEADVNGYTDPSVIMLLNKARLFDAGKKVATAKKQKAPPVKTLRAKKAPPTKVDRTAAKQKAAIDKLRNSASRGNDLDDIADAIMSRWAE